MRIKNIKSKLLIFLVFVLALQSFGLVLSQTTYSNEVEEENEGGQISAISAAPLASGHSLEGYAKAVATKIKIEESTQWQPTDYAVGDIVKSTYIVQLGDTLWEIAEGYYSDPFRWTEIVDHNFNAIGYLANGEHSLIFPDQVLKL